MNFNSNVIVKTVVTDSIKVELTSVKYVQKRLSYQMSKRNYIVSYATSLTSINMNQNDLL